MRDEGGGGGGRGLVGGLEGDETFEMTSTISVTKAFNISEVLLSLMSSEGL